MKKTSLSPPAVGGSSLLVIFSVLCLTVLALLSVSTVQAENRMAQASARAVADYYEADLQAETIFARLRAGETVPGVRKEGDIYRYSCPISQNQTLYVELQNHQTGWYVRRWQAVAHPEDVSDTLPVWNGAGENP